MTSHSAIVIGAGISGLAAAHELHKRGIAPIVLEAAGRSGGVILTERDGPFVIDAGPDSMLAAKPAGLTLCDELGLTSRLIRTTPPRTAYVLRARRLHPLPQPAVFGLPLTWRALAGASMISPAGRLRMALEPWVPPRDVREQDDDESIARFIGRRFGRAAVEYIAEPLLAGIHAGDVNRLSAQALFPSLVEAERTDRSVLRGLRAGRASRGPAASEGLFVSLAGGMQELVDTLVSALPAQTVRAGVRVTGIDREGSLFRVQSDSASGSLVTRAVILATPAWAVSQIVAPADANLATLCAEIPYTSTAIVVLGFDRAQVSHPLAGSGYVVPRAESTAILAATWITSKWHGRAPPDSVLIRAFVGGARDPAAVDRSDAELTDGAIREVAPIAGLAGQPRLTRVYRWRRASAQHEVGHLRRVNAIEGRLAALPGLFVTGSGFRATGIPDCIADARRTAAVAAAYLASSGRDCD